MWANRILLRENWPNFVGRAGASIKDSAGLLMYRQVDGNLFLFLVHPGGSYLRNQDLGTWTIPKGEIQPGEVILHAACRSFTEEVGVPAFGPFIPLEPAHERSGNIVFGWAFEGEFDPATASGQFSGSVDRAEWLSLDVAKLLIDPAQSWWIDQLVAHLRATSPRFANH